MVLDGVSTAIGSLDDKVAQAELDARGRAPAQVIKGSAERHLPTLWGRIRAVPKWIGTAADFITVGTVLAGALKLFGVF
jgi:hypothetical protein